MHPATPDREKSVLARLPAAIAPQPPIPVQAAVPPPRSPDPVQPVPAQSSVRLPQVQVPVQAPVPAQASVPALASHSGSVPGPIAQTDNDATSLRFQELMGKFLDVQQEVMVAYLQGSPRGSMPVPRLPAETALHETVPQLAIPAAAEMAAPAVPEIAVPAAPKVAAPVAAPVQAAPEPPRVDQIAGELVRLVAERTGYPPEMLGLDVDMEADLGIDSIKRVEILAAATQSLQPDSTTPAAVNEERMETLTKARTLRALITAFLAMDPATSNGHAPVPAAGNGHAPTPAAGNGHAPITDTELPRFVPTVVDAPIGTATTSLSGVVAITDDGQGVATALAESLRGRGIDVALIRHRPGPLDIGPDEYAASLDDAQATSDLIEAVRQQQGAITGLVHLLPLRAGPAFDALEVGDQQARVNLEARSLLHLAQAASADLRRPGVQTRLLTAVRMDGGFGYHHTGSSFQPSQGAVTGLVKTLAAEWPEVGCRVVDLDPAITNASELLAAELGSDDRQIEVGWSPGRRCGVRLAPAPLPAAGSAEPMISSDSVVLIVGGARGITAGVAREIARRFQPTIVIVGRSSSPEDGEAADTAGITEPRALRMALAARLGRAGAPATPAQVEPAYRRLLADRQVRANLAAIAELGARVHYHQLDVRDADGVAQLVDRIYAVHGRIDGVIYGAGVIEDKLTEGKTTDSFDRVVQTKTVGAFALARALRPESLTFFALFSSISARFGNPGQGDYAAANEVLNKLAAWLDARWPGRVTSLNWGPWKTDGMVSAEVERLMNSRGVTLIPFDHGVAALLDELDRGRKGDVEVLFGSGPWQVATPLLDDATVTQSADGIALTRVLDPDRDRYLRDHCLDQHPVLPMAVAMELMAEAAAGTRPGYEVTELRGLQLLRGVVLDDGPRPITVRAASAPPVDDGGIAVDVSIVDERAERMSYRAGVVLRHALPPAPPTPIRSSAGLDPFPMTVEQAYDELLFHGPLLQGISRIEGINDDGIVATLLPSSPQSCLAGAGPGAWIVDPVLLDSGFQLGLLWARTRLDMTALPSRIQRYRRFAALPAGPVHCDLRVAVRGGGHILDVQLAFMDPQGRLLVLIEGMELTGSRSLNRLAGAVAGGHVR